MAAFPSGAGKQVVSVDNGQQPRWSHDGSELFFFSGTASRLTLMSAAVNPQSADGDRLDLDPRAAVLGGGQRFSPGDRQFFLRSVAGCERFLINHREGPGDLVLNVVVNWRRAFDIDEESR